MRLEVFSLCDAATSEKGKLNILGAFDTIWVSKIPLVKKFVPVSFAKSSFKKFPYFSNSKPFSVLQIL